MKNSMNKILDLVLNPHGFSREHLEFSRWNRCPYCKKFMLLICLDVHKLNGEKINTWNIFKNNYSNYSLMDRSAIAKCPKCYKKWNIFNNSNLNISLSNRNQQSNKLQFKEIIQSERFEEHIGYEERNVDNSRSTVNSTRRFRVSKEWRRTYTIDHENSKCIGGEINIGINSILNIKALAEKKILSKYSLSKEEKQIYEEEIIVEIPAKTKVKILIYWKYIWQEGLILFNDEKNRTIQVPFKVITGLTFDQSQIDEK